MVAAAGRLETSAGVQRVGDPGSLVQETGVAEKRIKVATLKQIPRNYGTVVQAGDKPIALFKVQDTVYAIDNECPHRGGPIGEGSVKGKLVSCPWHLWAFDITSGQCLSNPYGHVRSYPVSVEGDDVWVMIE
jgi:3-phenylpropionate/trans-cinnamate dioxygenase ferredoxin component